MESRRVEATGRQRRSPAVRFPGARPGALATVAITALAASAFGGMAAPAALAADDCPNAKVRAQQGVSHLPNCYAYEKVTPNNKNGRIVGAEYLVSDDGSQLWMYANAPITDTVSGNVQTLLASRGTDGWGLEPITNSPLFGNVRNTGPADYLMLYQPLGMRGVLFSSYAPFDVGDVAGANGMITGDLYRVNGDGTTTWITRPVGFSWAFGETVANTGLSVLRSNEDATEILFYLGRKHVPATDSVDRPHVWIYREGQTPELVDRMPDGSVSTSTFSGVTATNATLWSTPNLGTIVWDTAAGTTTINRTKQLYARVGAGTPQARTVKITASHDGSAECTGTRTNAGTFRWLTADGRYVAFSCGTQLHPDAPASGFAYYVRDLQTGTLHYDATGNGNYGPTTAKAVPTSWERPDGTHRLEQRRGALWTVDLRTGEETCHSCALSAAVPSASFAVSGGVSGASAGGLGRRGYVNYVTPEGYVFFTTDAPAVPEDVNGVADLYMSDGTGYYLISGGDVSAPVEMGGVAADGSTVSFETTSSLLAEDRDGDVADIYVLRKNGGYYRQSPTTECASNCQGPAAVPGPVVAPLSVAFPETGDVADQDAEPIAVSGSRSVTGTRLNVKVRVPSGGRASVSGSGLRSTSRSVSKASTVTLTIKLSATATRKLRRTSSVRTTATVRFVPTSGDAQSKRVKVTFKKAKKQVKKASSRSVASAPTGKAAR